MDRLLPVDEALKRLLDVTPVLPVENIEVANAYGRVLAQDVAAKYDMPPFARAMLDGFAVQAEATQNASKEHPVVLKVLGTIPAGRFPEGACDRHSALRTMTGAPMAQGTDAIVRIEHAEEVTVNGERFVHIYKEVPVGEAVQPRGHDMWTGDVILSTGTRIGAVEMGVLALHGYSTIIVYALPRVKVMATGSELIAAEKFLRGGQLHDANTPMLTGLLSSLGVSCRRLPPASDSVDELSLRLREALVDCDVLVTTGGVSVGDFDLVPAVLEQLGVERLFWGVRMRPGTPIYAGRYGNTIVLALSGNPAAAYVNAHVFLVPLMLRLSGKKGADDSRVVFARLKQPPQKKRANHTRFLRGQLVLKDTELWIEFHPEQSSGTLGSLLGMTGLARIEPGADLSNGAVAPVYLIDAVF